MCPVEMRDTLFLSEEQEDTMERLSYLVLLALLTAGTVMAGPVAKIEQRNKGDVKAEQTTQNMNNSKAENGASGNTIHVTSGAAKAGQHSSGHITATQKLDNVQNNSVVTNFAVGNTINMTSGNLAAFQNHTGNITASQTAVGVNNSVLMNTAAGNAIILP